MNSVKSIIFIALILFFLFFSFSPTIFELSQANKLADSNREFILEHNYYWPDFNLYLSKVRQGWEGRFTALEKYTSEKHQGSLIQDFYVILGSLGRIFNLDPNFSYQLGRLILSPLLLLIILMLVKYYFPFKVRAQQIQTRFVLARQTWFDRGFFWQIIAFLAIIVSGSFPRFYTDSQGMLQVGRFMEWWSNIDALQRITFIPHILFGQVVSFYLLYQLTIRHSGNAPQNDRSVISTKSLILLIFLGNAAGLVFPPSLITLDGVLVLLLVVKIILNIKHQILSTKFQINSKYQIPNVLNFENYNFKFIWNLGFWIWDFLFIIVTLPSLLYLFFITKQLPWSALVEFHRTHLMMIPLDQYILGTGPIIFLGLFGAIISIIKRDKKWQPLILWVLVTFSFASLFSVIKEQSPLRFTQTGLFIPLGILGTYFFYQLFQIRQIRLIGLIGITFYLLGSIYMMKTSLDWQTTFIRQRVGANVPLVPYPPQTMYPIRAWMDGIRWLRDNTNHETVVLAEITAGNFIPAYAGNTVYFGQSNTVDYERKQKEVDRFFKGEMTPVEAKNLLVNGRSKYVFESVQEKEKSGGRSLATIYPFLKSAFSNSLVTIYLAN
ncbi:hypothetical protein HZB96_02575 [Candidatus Gottesmanbacteria bacterium]|nr:hypothetical protein [Candidatus Gottesmanbacteria bacterium]